MKYTAKVTAGDQTFTATTTADTALDARNKIGGAAVSAHPGKDISVSEIKEVKSKPWCGTIDFLSNLFNFKK